MRSNFTKIIGGNKGELREITSKETHGRARLKIWGRFVRIWMEGARQGRELGRRLREERYEEGRARNGWAVGIITLGSAPGRMAPT
jgi:hypothetical protein